LTPRRPEPNRTDDGARADRQRLDKWLVYARAVKSRSLAQKLIESGVVRVNSERTTACDCPVAAGDVLTMTLHNRLRVWRIVSTAERRGSAAVAAELYEDLSPMLTPASPPGGQHGGDRDAQD
jgi:ribosome-associated heat shock protein Hsp15